MFGLMENSNAFVTILPQEAVSQGFLSTAARGPALGAEAPNATSLAAESGMSTSSVLATAAVCGILAASYWRRSGRQQTNVSRQSHGKKRNAPRPYEYRFRAKPGDKYRYRFACDADMSEWGNFWIPDAEGRTVRYGEVVHKGTPAGPGAYWKRVEDEKNRPKPAAGALLLDCDGTLVETERDGHRVAFNKAFKELGYEGCEFDVALYGELLTTGGGKERMARYFKDYNAEAWKEEEPPTADHPKIVELHKLKTKLFTEIVEAGELGLREGIEELLSAADAAGWQIAVCSTSQEASVRAVVKTYLPSFASTIKIFAGDIVKNKKPSPDIYQLAAEELGVSAMKCVVVEDTNIGMKAAKAAYMQCIVTKSVYSEDEDFSEADMVLSSAEELSFEDDVVPMVVPVNAPDLVGA
eukprot:TRINITY_DN131_c0_g1_i1.p2 TRINITY_DN131_c0_g1~~TRINITY_DN131_c0_g1_i1.p2  ORF type:complete len:411 (-),score=144.38 TRINITY_DN131_c0_g1_i1:97-1329(-)